MKNYIRYILSLKGLYKNDSNLSDYVNVKNI